MPYIIETSTSPATRPCASSSAPRTWNTWTPTRAAATCGAKLQDDGADAGGGLYLVDLDTREAAQQFIDADPFAQAGLFERVAITRWRKAYVDGVATCKPAARPARPPHAPDGIAAVRLHPRGTSMSYADLSQARLYYVIDGPADAPVLVLSTCWAPAPTWARQVPELSKHFRVLRYDTRGHGKSSIPDGEYRFEHLAGDVAELLDSLGITRAHFCGSSMGGPTGIALALAHPERVDSLIPATRPPASARPKAGPRASTPWPNRRWKMAPALVERWLTDGYRAAEPGLSQVLVDMLRRTSDAGY